MRFPAQEALTAVNRATLGRPEGNGCLPPALRTNGGCLRPLRAGRRRSLPLGLARLATLGLIFEILVVEEMLLSRRKHKLRATIRTLDDSILKLRHQNRPRGPTQARLFRPLRTLTWNLLHLATTLLSVSLASQRLLDPLLFTRLQIEGVPFDLFDNVFLLHFTLEAPKGVFQRLTLLQFHFSQLKTPPIGFKIRGALTGALAK